MSIHKAKHVEARYYFLKKIVTKENLNRVYAISGESQADIFTKSMDKILLNKFREIIGMKHITIRSQREF